MSRNMSKISYKSKVAIWIYLSIDQLVIVSSQVYEQMQP